MIDIAFVDLEINDKNKIADIGAIYHNQHFHKNHLNELIALIKSAKFICGHNFLAHDLTYLRSDLDAIGKNNKHIIDTLLLSPLLFPTRPHHSLDKDYKIKFEESNNPLNDCIITQALLGDEIHAFGDLPIDVARIFYQLLRHQAGFGAFFEFIKFEDIYEDLPTLILTTFKTTICQNAPLNEMIEHSPVELSYALALIYGENRHHITPIWLQHQYPKIEQLLNQLRNTPCSSCNYCQTKLNAIEGLKRHFKFPNFRQYDDKPLQEQAATHAIQGGSLLAIFPTGGGKSVTFQVPALIAGECVKALTVVISPLQSLMKDQVDNLEQKGISEAVTINGLLDPIERQKSIERVLNGSASLLYISPESLRLKVIERLLLRRNVVRFVIDEAHCFSAWGQDFRVDYLYIGEFIRTLQAKKQLPNPIAISCFTATAKIQVIKDICAYFKQELDIELTQFIAPVTRHNLHYQVLAKPNEDAKYQALRHLIESHRCPTIVYVSRVAHTLSISKHLQQDGFAALAYHGDMNADEKIAHQNAFKADEAQIMVATSAFGMGVDKSNVGLVVHYDISDSLENYVQEAGRAGRDDSIVANCYVLFNESEDLDKHFTLLNQTKLSILEIKQIWRAIKELCGTRPNICESTLQIARQAGWNDLRPDEIDTRVKTAILALEDAGYIKRGQNMPRVFATGIVSKNAIEAINKINTSTLIHPDEKEVAIRIIKKLFSQKQKFSTDEDGESRIDYLADVLGLHISQVIKIITHLTEEGILADQKDLKAFIGKNIRIGDGIAQLNRWLNVEKAMLDVLTHHEPNLSSKEFTQKVQEHLPNATPKQINTLINFWIIKNHLGRHESGTGFVLKQDVKSLNNLLDRKAVLSEFVVRHILELSKQSNKTDHDWVEVNFSVIELKHAFNQSMFDPANLNEIENTLFYLLRMGVLKIEGGFLVIHQRLAITRLEKDNRKQYTLDDYKKLATHYNTKKEQIHIVGKYAQMMLHDKKQAINFVEDYFGLAYADFLYKYFNQEERANLKRNITTSRFNQWFGNLSPKQLQIIQDDKSRSIIVLASPGSGKTRVLVHKLASLYQLEDVKHENLLMLTFSRLAAHEFKTRLFDIMGNAASYIETKTFHSYCFDLLGRVGDLQDSSWVIRQAIDKINNGEVEPNRITKTVLVIDEAQDINADQFNLITTLMAHNEDMRVIMVGDDDQTIYTFNGASHEYMSQFLTKFGATAYDLVENYRSSPNVVRFCQDFAKHISHRLKTQEIKAINTTQGQVSVVNFTGDVLPYLLYQVCHAYDKSDSVAVLTQTNEETIWFAGQLGKRGIAHKLIQDNQGFSLKNLLEVRVFEDHLAIMPEQIFINEDAWEKAKQKADLYLTSSIHLPLLHNIISSFEKAYPKRKYVSDWRMFIKESSLEQFYHLEKGVITLSTIHKAKGREFDHVFVLIDHQYIQRQNLPYGRLDDIKKREFYVAFSRAKLHLNVFSNSMALHELLPKEGVQWFNYQGDNPSVRELVLYLKHTDVYLDKFYNCQAAIERLRAGANLGVFTNQYCWGCLDNHGNQVVVFSKRFKNELEQYQRQGYRLIGAKINFIVLWQNKEKDNAKIKIILPIVYLHR